MNFIKKWYTYQKERFPVLIYSTYILAIVVATFCYNSCFADRTYEILSKKIFINMVSTL